MVEILWRMVKKGFHADALSLMDNPEFSLELATLDKSLLKRKERIQANIVTGRNLVLWKLLSKIPII